MSAEQKPSPDAAAPPEGPREIAAPLTAGLVTAVVGFASSFVLVLEGLKHVGATPAQAISGLTALTLAFCAGMVWLAWRRRIPLTMAWSTPGSALLLTAAVPHTGFAGAVGGFLFCALLTALSGLIRPLERFVQSIPTSLTQAMIAGMLIPICLQPFLAAGKQPAAILPLLAVYAAMMLWAPRWAVPAVLVAALGESAWAFSRTGQAWGWELPRLEFIAPAWDLPALLSIGFGLFIVTMAGQNLPGAGVLRSHGHDPQWRGSMLVVGGSSAAGALFGAHAVNLSALSAGIALGEMSGQDQRTKWWATPAAALTYLVLAAGSGSMVLLMGAAPAGVMATLAGLALLPTFTSSAAAALGDHRVAAANGAVILIGASGVSIAGFSSAVFAFAAGLVMHAIQRRR